MGLSKIGQRLAPETVFVRQDNLVLGLYRGSREIDDPGYERQAGKFEMVNFLAALSMDVRFGPWIQEASPPDGWLLYRGDGAELARGAFEPQEVPLLWRLSA